MIAMMERNCKPFKHLILKIEILIHIFCYVRDTLKAHHSYGLHFKAESTYFTQSKVNFLYPYESLKLRLIFVYGKDYKSEVDIFRMPAVVVIQLVLIVLFIISAAVALRWIRKRFKLPRDDIWCPFIDCVIPFIGGGNLRMHHKWERMFFAIMLFGAFFIISVFLGDLLDNVLYIFDQRVTTLKRLLEVKPPVYTAFEPWGLASTQIYIVLQYVLFYVTLYTLL